MATPFDDGSARGATSMDHATPLPRRPETTPRGLPVSARPVALALDETVPSKHRSRRYRTSRTPQASEERMGFFAISALAIVSLVFISAVALGSMLTSTAVLHFGYAGRRFDTFRALHEPLVVGLFFGLGVLWLLPPHPWEMEPAQSDWKKRRSDRAKAAA